MTTALAWVGSALLGTLAGALYVWRNRVNSRKEVSR